MTTSEYARKIVELIDARPRHIDLDKLLYEIYVHAEIAEGKRDIEQGRWSTHEEVMEEMWEMIYSQFDGRAGRKKSSKKSSKKLLATRR